MADTMSLARNADGTYTPEFLAWEARLAFRVAAREFAYTTRRLARALGDTHGTATGVAVLAAAEHAAAGNPVVAERLAAALAARQALADAAAALADADDTFDIRPLLGEPVA